MDVADDHKKARRRYIGPGGYNGCPCCGPIRPDRETRKLETRKARKKVKQERSNDDDSH